MNILYLTISNIDPDVSGLYPDLVNVLTKKGHSVTVAYACQRREACPEGMYTKKGVAFLPVRTLNVTGNCGIIEKGLGTLSLEGFFLRAIKKHLSAAQFDLVLYATPPVTFSGVISYCRRHYGARSYLMLKDIFPQNALDIGMLSESGPRGLIYRIFKHKEKVLYHVSDRIGCMSPANREYLLAHEPYLSPEKVGICPNAVFPSSCALSAEEKMQVRREHGLPEDKVIFVYGGNLGRPQGIPFIIECLRKAAGLQDAFFLIVGSGSEQQRLRAFFEAEKPKNAILLAGLPKVEYDRVAASCDVGLIFLDHRFTIPNFPSRILSYMQAKLPVLACTDPVTDMPAVIEEGDFGSSCLSDDPDAFTEAVIHMVAADRKAMGERAYSYMCEHWTVEKACLAITGGTNEAA